MPDTADNQRAYPQPTCQEPGVGFPEARMVALCCASTGAIIDAMTGPAKGKSTGELSQMRILSRSLEAGDVLVGDAIYETFWTFAMLQSLGFDGLFEINGSRTRASKRRTHLTFERPQRPEWMDVATLNSYPTQITVRQVIERHRGLKDRVLITTLIDKNEVGDKEIVKLYKTR